MPTFRDFETVGEPVAFTDERRHTVAVWRARKSGGGDGRTYAVKCYAPRRHEIDTKTDDTLERDGGLKFIEGVKELRKAGEQGGRCLARIYDQGIAPEGAWYATDFYSRTLENFIGLRGKVDSEGLRHVVWSVAAGCLALQRSRGYSHGNLKTRNVYLVGRPRALRKTAIHLGDPYPAAPYQLSSPVAEFQESIGELFKHSVEVQDLLAIGELIFQLIEGRIVRRGDYEYPVRATAAWAVLGRDAERWRELCNQLLNPRLSLDQMNLEKLERDFQSRSIAPKITLILATVGAVGLLGAVLYGVSHVIHHGRQEHQQARQGQVESLDSFFDTGNSALVQADYARAASQFGQAEALAKKLKDNSREQDAEKRLDFSQDLAGAYQAQQAGQPDREIQLLQTAAASSPGIESVDTTVSKWLQTAQAEVKEKVALTFGQYFTNGCTQLDQFNFSGASDSFTKALKLARDMNDAGKEQSADKNLQYAQILSQAHEAGQAGQLDDEIQLLKKALGNSPGMPLTDEKIKQRLEEATQQQHQTEINQQAAAQEAELRRTIDRGNASLAQNHFSEATNDFQNAVGQAKKTGDRAAEQDAGKRLALAQALAWADAAKAAGDLNLEIQWLKTASGYNLGIPKIDAVISQRLNDAAQKQNQQKVADGKRLFEAKMTSGYDFLSDGKYGLATNDFANARTLAQNTSDEQYAAQSSEFAQALANAAAAKGNRSYEVEIRSLEAARRANPENNPGKSGWNSRIGSWLKAAQKDETMADSQGKLAEAMSAGNSALSTASYEQAASQFAAALEVAKGLGDTAAMQDAETRMEYARAMIAAGQARAANDLSAETEWLGKAAKISPELASGDSRFNELQTQAKSDKEAADERAEFKQAIAGGNAFLDQTNFDQAAGEFEHAAGLARKLNDSAGQQDASARSQYARSLAQADQARRARKFDDEIRLLNEVLASNLGSPSTKAMARQWLHDAQQTVKFQNLTTNLFGVEFVWVGPIKAFVEKTEMSQAEYQKLFNKIPDTGLQLSVEGDLPVCVKFDDINSSCSQLSEKSKSSGIFRLPAEDEFLAYSGINTTNGSNPDLTSLASQPAFVGANTSYNRKDNSSSSLTSVAVGAPNQYHLLNVLGNAWEWCQGGRVAGFCFYSSKGSRSLFCSTDDLAPGETCGVRLVFVPVQPPE